MAVQGMDTELVLAPIR